MFDDENPGLLIVFEGTDGIGKSTQLQLLYDKLLAADYPVLITREPTNGTYGQKIRQLYVNRDKYSHEEELELFLADRREHVDRVLAPSLKSGKIILCDRYFLSTAAYQGAVGFDPEMILNRNSFAPDPDLALLFQAPVSIGITRILSGRKETLNDFEQARNLEKVADIFSEIDRPYIKKIDAAGSIESVHLTILGHIATLFSNSQFPNLD